MKILKLLWKMILTVSIFDNSQLFYIIIQSKIICIAHMRFTYYFMALNFPKNNRCLNLLHNNVHNVQPHQIFANDPSITKQ